MEKLIITVAGVGAETTKEAQPALPVTAVEIGEDAARCREAGAGMYHLHVRDAGRQPRRRPKRSSPRPSRRSASARTSSSRPAPAARWA